MQIMPDQTKIAQYDAQSMLFKVWGKRGDVYIYDLKIITSILTVQPPPSVCISQKASTHRKFESHISQGQML